MSPKLASQQLQVYDRVLPTLISQGNCLSEAQATLSALHIGRCGLCADDGGRWNCEDCGNGLHDSCGDEPVLVLSSVLRFGLEIYVADHTPGQDHERRVDSPPKYDSVGVLELYRIQGASIGFLGGCCGGLAAGVSDFALTDRHFELMRGCHCAVRPPR